MEAWVNYSVISGDNRTILAKADGLEFSGFGYSVDSNSVGLTFGQVGAESSTVTTAGATLTTNVWYQVVAVWTNSVTTNTFELFINGVSQGSQAHLFTSVRNTTNPLYIGSFDGGIHWVNGRIGIVRLYNSALTSSQVLQNFNADKSIYGL
jgi:hypothetical protein